MDYPNLKLLSNRKNTLGVVPLSVSTSENPSNFRASTEWDTIIFYYLIRNNNLLKGF